MLPANLVWLEKQTPFSLDLKGIVDSLRTAKSSVVFTLEQAQMIRKKKQKELDEIDYTILQQQEYLKNIDNTFSACALVAEQSSGIESSLLLSGSKASGHRHNAKMPDRDDPAIFRLPEIREFFVKNANTNWRVAEIVEKIPSIKRVHAQSYLPTALTQLANEKFVVRVDRGVYRYTPEAKAVPMGTNA